jgi:ribonuclease R
MTRKKTQKKDKMKNSLTYIVSKVFEKNPNSILTHKQICTLIDVREHELRKLVFTILEDLCKQGNLTKHGHGIYGISVQNLIEGTIELTARGGGFVITDDEEDDIYIAPDNLGQALNGDRVKVRIIKKGKTRLEGVISSVIQRDKTQFVGTIEMHANFAFLIPDNLKSGTDIYIQKEHLNGAKNGDKALVKISVWPKSSKNPYGEVVQVLGKPGSNDVEMISILCNHGLDYTFPQEVMEEAERVGLELDAVEIKNRKDFRPITTFTIDPKDAKDFDDALSFSFLDNGNYEIGIHIADVSHYVQKDSAMDKEALKRSNSVYLVDRVIPMLPEQLSNLACSLRPNEDKFSFSAVFEISDKGKIYKEWYGKTVIHSDRRFTYEEAQEILEGKAGDYEKELLILDKIAKQLRDKRIKNGALEIESEEVRFRLDEHGQPLEVEIKRSKDAHKLIEEFMLLANKKIASFIAKPKKGETVIPFIYRIHDKPDIAKIGVFNVFINKFGYKLDFTHPDQISTSINKLLTDIRLKNEHSIIQSMAIRSMAKASYDTDNIGHYGLAFSYYTHFTSPIRRYADLIVHRILQEELSHKKHLYNNDLNLICKRISKMEKRAVEAERESTKYFQTVFVADKKGEIFKGTISGLADFGIFVKMDENHCEGMVSLPNIPGDRYYFDAEKYTVIGSKTKRELNLGDAVCVKIVDVYPRKRQIELELIIN